jgi:hypothetical protein
MRRSCFLCLLVALSFGLALMAHAQDDDSPSLGDVARQSRQAKQQRDGQPENANAGQSNNAASDVATSTDTSKENAGTATPKNDSKSSSNGSGTSAAPSSGAAVKHTPTSKSAKKVISNEDIGMAHISDEGASDAKTKPSDPASSERADAKNSPDYWSSRILSQKNAIAALKSDIDQLSASIQYAPGNCVEGCVEWNQHQQEKQQQVDSMKAQLEDMQKQLDDMQENARKQGYGSSVYDP